MTTWLLLAVWLTPSVEVGVYGSGKTYKECTSLKRPNLEMKPSILQCVEVNKKDYQAYLKDYQDLRILSKGLNNGL
jgi:hypothetical protein